LTHRERLEKRKLASLAFPFASGNQVRLFDLLTHGERLEGRKLASLALSSCFRKPCQPVPSVDPREKAGGVEAGLLSPFLLVQKTL